MEEKVKTLMANQLNIPVEKVSLDSLIVEDLGADSLDVVEMLMTLEEEFGVTLSDDQAKNLKTVQDICDVLKQLK